MVRRRRMVWLHLPQYACMHAQSGGPLVALKPWFCMQAISDAFTEQHRVEREGQAHERIDDASFGIVRILGEDARIVDARWIHARSFSGLLMEKDGSDCGRNVYIPAHAHERVLAEYRGCHLHSAGCDWNLWLNLVQAVHHHDVRRIGASRWWYLRILVCWCSVIEAQCCGVG